VGQGSLVMGALVVVMELHDACHWPERLNIVDHAHSTTNEDRV